MSTHGEPRSATPSPAHLPHRRASEVAWAASTPSWLAPWAQGLRRDLEDADAADLERVLTGATSALLAEFDPSGAGVPRGGRHTDRSWWLYYDGELSVIAAVMDAGQVIAPHNHGNWNVTGVWQGALEYVAYERLDDGSREDRADLRVRAAPVVTAGQSVLCPPPPHDIHEVRCIEDRTVTVLVAPPFADEREYYEPADHRYTRRRGGGPAAVPGLLTSRRTQRSLPPDEPKEGP